MVVCNCRSPRPGHDRLQRFPMRLYQRVLVRTISIPAVALVGVAITAGFWLRRDPVIIRAEPTFRPRPRVHARFRVCWAVRSIRRDDRILIHIPQSSDGRVRGVYLHPHAAGRADISRWHEMLHTLILSVQGAVRTDDAFDMMQVVDKAPPASDTTVAIPIPHDTWLLGTNSPSGSHRHNLGFRSYRGDSWTIVCLEPR